MDMVGGIPTPLKNMSPSIGMMTFPRYGKIKHVPNHQPVRVLDGRNPAPVGMWFIHEYP